MSGFFEQITMGVQQLSKGGFMLLPLLFFSLLALSVALERFATLRRDRLIPSEYIARIFRLMENGKYETALALCARRPELITDLLRFGIEHRHERQDELMANVRKFLRGRQPILYKNLFMLSLVATLAPLLGLLGTVIGMIESFGALYSEKGLEQLTIVADGISVALLTTFAGLIVAVPTYIAHQYIQQKADRLAAEFYRYAVSMVHFLKAEHVHLFDVDEEPEPFDVPWKQGNKEDRKTGTEEARKFARMEAVKET